MTMGDEVKGVGALQKLQRDLEPLPPAGIDPQALCRKYQEIRPTLQIALEFLQHFPFIGRGVKAALGFLMTLADTLCPAPAPTPASKT
jgi:hypothetical protein